MQKYTFLFVLAVSFTSCVGFRGLPNDYYDKEYYYDKTIPKPDTLYFERPHIIIRKGVLKGLDEGMIQWVRDTVAKFLPQLSDYQIISNPAIFYLPELNIDKWKKVYLKESDYFKDLLYFQKQNIKSGFVVLPTIVFKSGWIRDYYFWWVPYSKSTPPQYKFVAIVQVTIIDIKSGEIFYHGGLKVKYLQHNKFKEKLGKFKQALQKPKSTK